ncbi:hypothetical protein MTO96_049933 [Rhipicephalus appendiculatus]
MDNCEASPASAPGPSLSTVRSRQMETFLKQASRIMGKHASPKGKFLSPKGVSVPRKVRTLGRSGSTRAASSKKQKRVSPRPLDVEENTPESISLHSAKHSSR